VCGDYEPIRPVAADRSPWNSVLRFVVMVVVVEAVEPEAAFVATLKAVKAVVAREERVERADIIRSCLRSVETGRRDQLTRIVAIFFGGRTSAHQYKCFWR